MTLFTRSGRVPGSCMRGSTHNDIVREAKVDRVCALDALDLFGRKGYFQRLDILLEILDLPAAD